jgi:hypothetical protein
MGQLLSPAAHAAAFTLFFLAFSLSLDFWGRLVLRALKADGAAEPDTVFGCIAGAACAAVLCRWLSYFTRSFEVPFAVFVALGALGAAFGIAEDSRARPGSSASPRGLAALRFVLLSREWALVSSLTAFALAFWFAGLWPSGGLEPWYTDSGDYYAWIFEAGYWMGYKDVDTYGILNQHRWNFDAFGTYILFAMYSSARGAPAYLAAPGFAILLLSWIGCGIYVLVRRLAGFPRWLSWLAALGVVGGWFFKLILFNGIFGQMTATAGYLLLMRAALAGPRMPDDGRATFAGVFFPLLFLMLSYQAGFFLFAALFAAARFLLLRLSADAGAAGVGSYVTGGVTDGSPSGIVAGIVRNAWSACRPVIVSLALAAAVSPQTAAQLAGRTFSAAVQTAGYGVGFLDPMLFAGFPLIAETGFGVFADVGSARWAAFLAAFGFLAAYVLRAGAAVFPGRDLSGMKTLSVLFALLLLSYLAGFAAMGDDYRVWKFVSLTALPLSFVPGALLVTAVHAASRGKRRLGWIACAVFAAAVAFPQLAYRNPAGQRASLRHVRSLLPIAEAVRAALEFDRESGLVVFDFSSIERTFAAMVVSQYSDVGRVRFVNAPYFGEAVMDYLPYAERGVPVYSDMNYPDLYRGGPVDISGDFTVFRYDSAAFRRKGGVSYRGIWPFTWFAGERRVGMRILVPEALSGRDLAVRISFTEGMDGRDGSCRGPLAREAHSPPSEGTGREDGVFLLRVPRDRQRAGHVRLTLEFPELPVRHPPDGLWGSGYSSLCRYRFRSVELTADKEPAGEDTKGEDRAEVFPEGRGETGAGPRSGRSGNPEG